MRILLVHNRYKQRGGEDAVFFAESKLLIDNGHDVQHVVYDNSKIVSILQRIRIGLTTIYNPRSAKVILSKINDFRPNIIHVHNILPMISPSIFFVAKQNRIPVIFTLHNYRLICPSAILFFHGKIYEKSIGAILPLDAIWKGVYRNSSVQTGIVALMTAIHNILGTWKNKVDFYITLTKFSKSKFEMSALNIPKQKLLVKPNFVEDCEQIENLREDYFLFVGRLTEEKGIKLLLKSASIYKFNLVVVGEGPLSETVSKFAAINSNVKYTGVLPKDKVMDYLRKCKALIFPSIWYEGFPVTIIEAFSVGTPVVTSNIGGMKEIVDNGFNGLHFISGNEIDLSSNILKLNNQPELLKRLSVNARQTYLNLYTPEKNYAQLIAVYEKALKRYAAPKGVLLPHRV